MQIEYSDYYIRDKKFDERFMLDTFKYRFEGKNEELIKIKNEISNFNKKVYQLNYEGKDYEMFLWSDKGWNGTNEMTQFTIDFNSYNEQEHIKGIAQKNELEKLLKNIDTNAECICYEQYYYIDYKLRKLANEICETLLDKKIEWNGIKGRIIKTGRVYNVNDTPNYTEYLFKANRQRTRAYTIKDEDVCFGKYKEVA